ncbi:MAG: TetR/AcrR family transcriptional regulator [Chloroflexota bacterium]
MSQDTNSPHPDTASGVDETRQRLIQAAAQVFSEKGYAGATTRAIAAAADVNEVTLFRHFGSKKNLLMAVIDRFSALPGLEAALEDQLTGDYRQDLQCLGNHFMDTMRQRRAVVLMMLCEAERLPEVSEAIAQVPDQQRQLLGKYLRQQMARGAVRELNPEMAAQVFFGMFFAYSISQTLLAGTPISKVSPEVVVAQFVDIFVQGTIRSEKESDVDK